jgi:hypothetical protein
VVAISSEVPTSTVWAYAILTLAVCSFNYRTVCLAQRVHQLIDATFFFGRFPVNLILCCYMKILEMKDVLVDLSPMSEQIRGKQVAEVELFLFFFGD